MMFRFSLFMTLVLSVGLSGCGKMTKKSKVEAPVGTSTKTSSTKGVGDLQNGGEVNVSTDASTHSSSSASVGSTSTSSTGTSTSTSTSSSSTTSPSSTPGTGSSSTITTPTIACSGYVLDGVCWYAAPAGTSCNTFCTNHGGSEDHLVNRSTCRTLIDYFIDNQRGWLPTIAKPSTADWAELPSAASCSVFATARLTTLYNASSVSASYENPSISNVCSCTQ